MNQEISHRNSSLTAHLLLIDVRRVMLPITVYMFNDFIHRELIIMQLLRNRTKFIRCGIIGFIVISLIIVIVYNRSESSEVGLINKYHAINNGDSYELVISKFGAGTIIKSEHVTRIRARHPQVGNETVPVVTGHTVYEWKFRTCRIYVAFDDLGNVVDKYIIDTNYL